VIDYLVRVMDAVVLGYVGTKDPDKSKANCQTIGTPEMIDNQRRSRKSDAGIES